MLTTIRQRLNREEGGFTLIELLVVLIIIGILVAIAIPSYLSFRDRAEKRAAQSNVRSAVPAVETYYSDQTPTNTYAGMTVAKLKLIDAGIALDSEPSNLSATTYCIQDTEGKFTAWKNGPAAQVQVGEAGAAGVGCA